MFQSRHNFQASITQIERSSPRLIILDCTNLSYIDSAGLGLLLLYQRLYSTMDIRIVIANAQPNVRDILFLANLDKKFMIFDTVAVVFLSQSKTIAFPC